MNTIIGGRVIVFFVMFLCGVVYAQERYTYESVKPIIERALEVDLDTAMYYAKLLEKSALERGDSSDLMEAYNYIGFTYRQKNKPYLAQDYLKKAVELRRKYSDACALAIGLSSLGGAYHLSEDYDEAILNYLEAVSFADSDNYECVYSPMINLTKLYLDLEENEKAKGVIDKTVKILPYVKDTLAKYRYENLIGLYYLNTEKYDSAEFYFNHFLDYGLHYGTQNDLANAYNNLAIVFFNSEQYKESKYNFEKAFEVRKRQGDTSAIMASLMNLGFYHQSLNQMKEAERYYLEGLTLAQQTNSIFYLRDFHEALTSVYKSLGNKDKVIETYEKYLKYFRESLRKINKNRIEELEARYRYRQQKREIDLTKQSNEKLQALNLKISKERDRVQSQNYILLGLLILLLISFSFIIYFFNKNKRLETDLEITTLGSEEKTTLIKEIHHRVKNNLQIITSLLRLQASTIEDDKVVNHFLECQQRVAAMALVHEKLYLSNDLSRIDLPEYVDELIRNLVASYATGVNVLVKTKIEVAQLDLDTVIPLSLIINETVTNSFKHGLDKTIKDFTIICEITKEGNVVELLIGDTGVGFPEGFSLKKTGTLGTELIDTLIDQLDGKVVVLSDRKGAFYNIKFPIKE